MTGVNRTRSFRAVRLGSAVAAGLLAVSGLAACGGSDSDDDPTPTPTPSTVIGADTKCSDYVKMTEQEQVRVIQSTSRELDDEFVSSAQAMSAVDSIKQVCQESDLKDGTMRDIAEAD